MAGGASNEKETPSRSREVPAGTQPWKSGARLPHAALLLTRFLKSRVQKTEVGKQQRRTVFARAAQASFPRCFDTEKTAEEPLLIGDRSDFGACASREKLAWKVSALTWAL